MERATSPEQPASPSPAAYLLQEHLMIKRVVAVLFRLAALAREEDRWETGALRLCVDFLQLFADGCHHAKEEDLLFPVMGGRTGTGAPSPVGVLLFEHGMARRFTAEMAETLEDAAAGNEAARGRFFKVADEYVGLLTHHIYKEDFELFPEAESSMSAGDREDLHALFCRADCGSFDNRSREELIGIAAELTER